MLILSSSVATLFKQGADPNHIDKTFGSPFHLAIASSKTKIASALIATMLQAGANPNLRATNEGLTPVHVAAAWGRSRCLQQLVSHGGDTTLTTSFGQTVSELIDDIADEADRSQCKSVLERASYTTGSMYNKSKSRLLGTPDTTSLRSLRRKILNDCQVSKCTDSEKISHTELTVNTSNYNCSLQSSNTSPKEENSNNHSFESHWNDNDCRTVDHESTNTMENVNNCSKVATSSPQSDFEKANQFSSSSTDSTIDSLDLNDDYNSTLYDVTALNGSSHLENSQHKSSKPICNLFQSSSSSFCSISSIESSDSENQDLNVLHSYESTNDSDEITDVMNSKLFIEANDNVTDENVRHLIAGRDNYYISTEMNYASRRLVDTGKEPNEQISYGIGHNTLKHVDDSSSQDSDTVDNEKKLKISQSPTCSYEVTATPEFSDTTWNDCDNFSGEDTVAPLEDDLYDDDIWSDYVSDSNSIESEGDTIEEEVKIPTAMLSWSDDKIRQELQSYGEAPGPITATTRKFYLTCIVKLKRQIPNQVGSKSTISIG